MQSLPQSSQAGSAKLSCPEGGTFSGLTIGARITFEVLVRSATTAESTHLPSRHGCCLTHSRRDECADTLRRGPPPLREWHMTTPSELQAALLRQHPPLADWLEALSRDGPF